MFTKQRWLQFHIVFLRRITICITIINSRIKQSTASHVNSATKTILRLPLFQIWRVANFERCSFFGCSERLYRMWCLTSSLLAFHHHAVPRIPCTLQWPPLPANTETRSPLNSLVPFVPGALLTMSLAEIIPRQLGLVHFFHLHSSSLTPNILTLLESFNYHSFWCCLCSSPAVGVSLFCSHSFVPSC